MASDIRPMGIGELLDRTFFFYRKYFLLFTGIVALSYLAPVVVQLASVRVNQSPSPALIMAASLLLIIFTIAAYVVSLAATINAVSDIYLDRPAGIRIAFAGVRGNLTRIVLTLLYGTFGTILGLLCLIVPGIILMVAWSLAIPIVILEKKKPFEAMRRSFHLTKGRRFRIFVSIALISLIVYIIIIVVILPFTIPLLISTIKNPGAIPTGFNIMSMIADYISKCLALPISTIAISLIYYDQRVRKEGFDLEVMMASLPESDAADTQPAS